MLLLIAIQRIVIRIDFGTLIWQILAVELLKTVFVSFSQVLLTNVPCELSLWTLSLLFAFISFGEVRFGPLSLTIIL